MQKVSLRTVMTEMLYIIVTHYSMVLNLNTMFHNYRTPYLLAA